MHELIIFIDAGKAFGVGFRQVEASVSLQRIKSASQRTLNSSEMMETRLCECVAMSDYYKRL